MSNEQDKPREERIQFITTEEEVVFKKKKSIFVGPERKTQLGQMHIEGIRIPNINYRENDQGIYILGQRAVIEPAEELFTRGFYEIRLAGQKISYSHTKKWNTRLYLPGEITPFLSTIDYAADAENDPYAKGAYSLTWRRANTKQLFSLFARPDPKELRWFKFSFHQAPK